MTEAVESFFDPELHRLQDQLSRRGYDWVVPPEVVELLLRDGFDSRYGARHLKRVIRRRLHAPVASVLLDAGPGDGPRSLVTTVLEDEIVATIESV
ncbi:hypothetical protein [Rhodococcus qingshengii]|uniref:hypothetical protein n=1 Tax=Rhodococcus qingshengii TaxID=334542 RepID=UPI0027E0AADE|nr:hypothetical protein [Rhodococcus qingshengii]